jgi:hypothetical protein
MVALDASLAGDIAVTFDLSLSAWITSFVFSDFAFAPENLIDVCCRRLIGGGGHGWCSVESRIHVGWESASI